VVCLHTRRWDSGGIDSRDWPLLLDDRVVQWFIRRPSMATISGKGRELSGGRSVRRLSYGEVVLLMTRRGNKLGRRMLSVDWDMGMEVWIWAYVGEELGFSLVLLVGGQVWWVPWEKEGWHGEERKLWPGFSGSFGSLGFCHMRGGRPTSTRKERLGCGFWFWEPPNQNGRGAAALIRERGEDGRSQNGGGCWERSLWFLFFQRKERSPTSIKEIGFRFRFSPSPPCMWFFFSIYSRKKSFFFLFSQCLVKHLYLIFF